MFRQYLWPCVAIHFAESIRNAIPILLADKSVFHPVVHPEIPYRTDKLTAADSCRLEIKFSRSGRP